MVAFEKLRVENYIKYFNNEYFRLHYVKYSSTADETKKALYDFDDLVFKI